MQVTLHGPGCVRRSWRGRLLASNEVEGWGLSAEVDHPLGGSGPTRLLRRWLFHPRRVRQRLKQRAREGGQLVLLVTDQEQAHLVPRRVPRNVKKAVIVHDLFILAPRVIPLADGPMKEWTGRRGLVRRLDLRRLRRGLKRADLLICVSQATADRCQEVFRKVPVAHVPTGISVQRYAPTQDAEVVPEPGCPLLVVGNDHARKRMNFLAKVLAACPEDVRKDLHLIRVGGGQTDAGRRDLAGAMEAAGVRLSLKGRIEDDELQQLRLSCEALLFPSAAEGYGYPPVEAMAAGLPVLVADMPNHGSMVPVERRLPVDDVEAWIDAITDVHATWAQRTNGGADLVPRPADEALLSHVQRFSFDAQSTALGLALDALVNDGDGRAVD
ncbi:MAG: glycosyltransferase [Candidatus Poseidoniaceae archaeon]